LWESVVADCDLYLAETVVGEAHFFEDDEGGPSSPFVDALRSYHDHPGAPNPRGPLSLPEDHRLELASEIIASVDGPRDADWDGAWLAELDRRVAAGKLRGEAASDWSEARARILERIART
jgi:putative addiction module component